MSAGRWSNVLAAGTLVVIAAGSLAVYASLTLGATTPVRVATRATLADAQGDVTVFPASGGGSHAGTAGEALYAGDRVRTGAPGRAAIMFPDGSRQELDAATDVLIRSIGGGGGVVALVQTRGVTVNVVAEGAAPRSYQLEEPGAIALAGGTRFRARVVRNAVSGALSEENVSVEAGSVLASGGSQEVVLQPGQSLRRVPPGSVLEPLGLRGTSSGTQAVLTSQESGVVGGSLRGETLLSLVSVDGSDATSTSCGVAGQGNTCHFAFASPASGTLAGLAFSGTFTSTLRLAMTDQDGTARLEGEHGSVELELPAPDSGTIVLSLSSGPTGLARISQVPLAWRGQGSWTAVGGRGSLKGVCFDGVEGSGLFELSRLETDAAQGAKNHLMLNLGGDLSLQPCGVPSARGGGAEGAAPPQ